MSRWLAIGLLLASSVAQARDYEVRIEVQDTDDLYDLQESGYLSEDEVELLVALLHRPMDINRADRYLLYDLPEITYQLADAIVKTRAEKEGGFASLEELLDTPGMTEEILRSIRPFVQIIAEEVAEEDEVDLHGKVTTGGLLLDQLGDDLRADHVIRDYPNAYIPNAFVRIDTYGLKYFGAGGLLTVRPLVYPAWDRSRGRLMTESASDKVSLDSLYIYGARGVWRAILGNYNVGFGERLTIDTTNRYHPSGWDERTTYYLRRDEGDIRPRRNLLGAAVTVDGVDFPIGWLDATVFASYQINHLYQYDMKYGFDDVYGENNPSAQADCPDGYTLYVDGKCRSSRVYQDDVNLLWQTFGYAFNEFLVGGNVSWSFDERTRVGATVYRSETELNIAQSADPVFAYSAKYPRYPTFGAAGMDASVGRGPFEAALEGSVTFRGDPAAVGRFVLNPSDWSEVELSLRYYGRDYENPHSRSTASRIEKLGLTRRNEAGGRLQVNLRPIKLLKLVTSIDLWAFPEQILGFVNGTVLWKPQERWFLRSRQRVDFLLSSKETISLQGEYKDNVLGEGGHDEYYRSDDENEYGYRTVGRGSKVNLRLAARTKRIPRTNLSAKLVFGWEDVEKIDDRFDTEAYVRLGATVYTWPGGKLYGAMKYWVDDQATEDEPHMTSYVGVKQRIADSIDAAFTYGIVMELRADSPDDLDDDPEEDFLHFGMLKIDARF